MVHYVRRKAGDVVHPETDIPVIHYIAAKCSHRLNQVHTKGKRAQKIEALFLGNRQNSNIAIQTQWGQWFWNRFVSVYQPYTFFECGFWFFGRKPYFSFCCFLSFLCTEFLIMVHTHCMGQGQGLEMMGFYIMLCTTHTTQGQGQGTIVFYSAHSGPCPCSGPGPKQCIWAISLDWPKDSDRGESVDTIHSHLSRFFPQRMSLYF